MTNIRKEVDSLIEQTDRVPEDIVPYLEMVQHQLSVLKDSLRERIKGETGLMATVADGIARSIEYVEQEIDDELDEERDRKARG